MPQYCWNAGSLEAVKKLSRKAKTLFHGEKEEGKAKSTY